MATNLRQLIDQARQDDRVPEPIGERCVHALIETASCRACVTACPRGAWVLDDESLGIDQDACDGCGLCVPACPQGAIAQAQPVTLPIRERKGRKLALLACEKADLGDAVKLMPCVHAIGVQDLLILVRKGIRILALTTGSCADCNNGRAQRMQSRVEALNITLKQSGHDIRLFEVNRDAYRSLLDGRDVEEQRQVGRRGFLKNLASTSVNEYAKWVSLARDEQAPVYPPGRLLPDTTAETRWPCLPTINVNQCNGCDTCARVCPHQAIALQKDEESARYLIHPKRCTGCNICTDICEQDAVRIHQWQKQRQGEVLLEGRKCNACGVVFHSPAENPQAAMHLCRICARHNHHKNLYQVLD